MNHLEEACIPLTPVYMSNTRATHDLRRFDIAPREKANRRTEKRKIPVRGGHGERDNKNKNLRRRRENKEREREE